MLPVSSPADAWRAGRLTPSRLSLGDCACTPVGVVLGGVPGVGGVDGDAGARPRGAPAATLRRGPILRLGLITPSGLLLVSSQSLC